MIYDIAVPAERIAELLRKIPPGSGVLIQKPLGRNLAEAEELLKIANERQLKAAVNEACAALRNISTSTAPSILLSPNT